MLKKGRLLPQQSLAPTKSCPCREARPSEHPWECVPQFLELFRIFQEIDNLLDLFFGFLNAGYILEGHAVPISRAIIRALLLPKFSAPFAGIAELLAKDQIEGRGKDDNRQKLRSAVTRRRSPR